MSSDRPVIPVADLHCDLLAYLMAGEMFGDEQRSPHDRRSLCSLPQMSEGGVCFQALPIFCLTQPGWSRWGVRQAELFAEMLERQEDHVRPISRAEDLAPERPAGDGRIALLAAVENASAFAEEDEHLDRAIERLDQIRRLAGPLLYISLTWNAENRFGGGCDSKKGLLDDGRILLEHMNERGIAIDLSHTSPRLAHEILDFTYAKSLDLPVLASHSNYGGLVEGARHLPDEPAKEVARRGGVIGLNVLARFLVGEPPDCFADQIAYSERLGIGESQVLGTDFFYPGDIPPPLRVVPEGEEFHADFADASCHQRLLRNIEEAREMERGQLEELAHGRALRFVRRVLGN